MLHFATLFDINYLSRGLSLYYSLERHCRSNSFILYVLALDIETKIYFDQTSELNIQVISLEDIETHFPELCAAKSSRSKVEYYFTLSPCLPLYILNQFDHVDRITTMDADLFFFSDPARIFNTYPEASVLITPHNFSKENEALNIWGKYNVSFQSFKRDERAIQCLEHWKEKCIEWCYDSLDIDNNRFADQKYLDEWQQLFTGIKSIDMIGTGLAPWNISNYEFSKKGDMFFVNDAPLIYFHFQHLRIFGENFASNGFSLYEAKAGRVINQIYHTYLLQLSALSKLGYDGNIIRNRHGVDQSLLTKLIKTDGYYFFTNNFIIAVNIYKYLKKLLPS